MRSLRAVVAHTPNEDEPVIGGKTTRLSDTSKSCMKNEQTTAMSQRHAPLSERWSPAIVQAGRIGQFFAASLLVTTAFVYTLLTRIDSEAVTWGRLIQDDILWPILLLAATLAIGLSALIRFATPRKAAPPATPASTLAPPAETFERQSRINITRQVLRLSHNAERLDSVERDLIRQLSHNWTVDKNTHRLLTEMRVCTNRLRGQLSYLKEVDLMAVAPTNLVDRKPDRAQVVFEPPELGLPKYETPQHRRRSIHSQP
jgi:hypothetical protein